MTLFQGNLYFHSFLGYSDKVRSFGSVQKRGRYLFREKVDGVGGEALHSSTVSVRKGLESNLLIV